jgi:hypothetical protein
MGWFASGAASINNVYAQTRGFMIDLQDDYTLPLNYERFGKFISSFAIDDGAGSVYKVALTIV